MNATAKTVNELRAEYRSIRAGFLHENSRETKANFDEAVRSSVMGTSPEDFIAAAKDMTTRCGRCSATGRFITYVENGQPKGPGGECFRCCGKGYQTYSDVKRNEVHDMHWYPISAPFSTL